ncbi:MAG: alkaline phosphatase D family protein [Alphaproteobacteria bacterium]|nr:alkaline phosphatase D family protein [Alphaproteobacteria bacterium]
MTGLILHPRAAPEDKARLWLCVENSGKADPADPVVWKLNGAVVEAETVRPLSAAHVHSAALLTGIFELSLPAANAFNRIEAKVFGQSAEVQIRRFPQAMADNGWFRLLLCSCYHQAEDRQALVSQSFLNIPAAERQDLSLFMGDQVYLDLPTLNNYPDNEARLAERFEQYYRTNWTTYVGLDAVLKTAPSVFCPDDHEYWNNFPHWSPIIQNSWTPGSRMRWKSAADQLYDAFQCAAPAVRGDNIEIDVDPLSVLVLDQRSQRKDDRSATLGPDGLAQLNNWVNRLIKEKKFGAVVTGQSLLDKPVGAFKGAVADWMLPNYEDYAPIVKALSRLSDHGRPVLLLTGDVHWGRVTRIKEGGRTRFIEIICSPSSLVSTIGGDQLSTIGAGFRRFFRGEKTRWPRHADAPDAEPFFAQTVFGKRYRTEVVYRHKGDQLAMLALRRAADTLEAKVTYYEIHKRPNNPRQVPLGLLR